MQPQPTGVVGGTGLANTANPMLQQQQQQARKLTKGATSNQSMQSGDESPINRKAKSGFFNSEKRIVLVKGILRIDPQLNFMPDWM